MEEMWRDIPGWEGYYQASSLGRLRRLRREVLLPNGGIVIFHEKVLTGYRTTGGYRGIKFCLNGKVGKNYLIHRLIYLTWMGDIPEGLTVDHINGDKQDNRSENLRLLTPDQNSGAYSRKKGSRGVHFSSRLKRWIAKTTVGVVGKTEEYLGSYETKEEAQAAYDKRYMEIKGKMW